VILPHSLAMIGNAAEEKFGRLRRALGLAPNGDLAQYIADLNARIGLPASLSAMGVKAHGDGARLRRRRSGNRQRHPVRWREVSRAVQARAVNKDALHRYFPARARSRGAAGE
jgi:alcohol dehydrogenase class IV